MADPINEEMKRIGLDSKESRKKAEKAKNSGGLSQWHKDLQKWHNDLQKWHNDLHKWHFGDEKQITD